MENEAYLLAGFCRVDVTPKESQPLAGYGNTLKRMSNNVLDQITATCIALTDTKGETVLLFTNDIINNIPSRFEKAVNEISNATGVPIKNIKITATHTHSAPDPFSAANEITKDFYDNLIKSEVKAAKTALEDRVPAYIKIGETKTNGLNFIRHYIAEDGCVVTDNHDARKVKGSPLVKHCSQIDETMQIIRFVRTDVEGQVCGKAPENKKDIIYVNWRSHATKTGGLNKFDMSADFPSSLRYYVEDATGCHCAYYQGCAGNVNPQSRIENEKITFNNKYFGLQLAGYVVASLRKLKNAVAGEFEIKNKFIEYPVNHENEDKLEFCYELSKKWEETNDRELVTKLGKPYGIFSPYHANAIIRHSKMPKTLEGAELSLIKFGNIALCYLPGEPFAKIGMDIRNASPVENTVVMGYSNASIGYIPTKEAFECGCYEAEHTPVGKGTAELITKEMIEMLK